MADPRALVRTPLIKRVSQAVVHGLSGGWFTPEMPPVAQQPQTAGRRLDYLPGYNIATRPRRDSGIDFQTLRNFAYYYDILRLLLEKRKDQITTFTWSVVPTDEAVENGLDGSGELDKRADIATNFLKSPDGRQSWNTWLRGIVEDMLVLDAIALWPVYDGKQLVRLEQIDPSTIKLVIDESGRRPEPPFPAYQQVLHGVPTADFQKDELLYFISNPASNRIYGMSKVEQCLMTIQIGLRRESSQLQFFTDGNVPAALVGVPDKWPAATIAQFQSTFDSILQGDTAARRKIWFVPGEAAKNMKEFKSEESLLKTPFDEWIIRILCFNFGVAPTPFINQVNRATAFTAQEEAREEGLGPALMFLKDTMDIIIQRALGLKNVEFKWELEQETDPQAQAQIDDLQLRNGSRSIDELRQRDGLDGVGIGPMVYTGTGPVPLSMFKDGTAPSMQPKQPPPAADGSDQEEKPTKPGQAPKAGGKSADKPGPNKADDAQEGRLSKDAPFRAGRVFRKTTRYYNTVVPQDRTARAAAESKHSAALAKHRAHRDRPTMGED